MSELQDMLRVQARLHRKQGANALGDLFENALNEIELLKKTYNQLFDAVQGEREQLAKANERESILSCQLESHIERVAELEKENKRESMELRSRLGSALGRNSEYNSAIETVAYRCFLAGLTTEKPREPNVQNNTATAISHFNVMVDRHARSASRHILEQLRKEQE